VGPVGTSRAFLLDPGAKDPPTAAMVVDLIEAAAKGQPEAAPYSPVMRHLIEVMWHEGEAIMVSAASSMSPPRQGRHLRCPRPTASHNNYFRPHPGEDCPATSNGTRRGQHPRGKGPVTGQEARCPSVH